LHSIALQRVPILLLLGTLVHVITCQETGEYAHRAAGMG